MQSGLNKPGEQENKHHSSMVSESVPAPGSCFKFLPWLSSVMECGLGGLGLNKPFPPQLALVVMLITVIENKVTLLNRRRCPGEGLEFMPAVRTLSEWPHQLLEGGIVAILQTKKLILREIKNLTRKPHH